MGISEQPGLVSNKTPAQVACGGGGETLLHVPKPSTTFVTAGPPPTHPSRGNSKSAGHICGGYVLMHGKTFAGDNLISEELIKGVVTFSQKSGSWE